VRWDPARGELDASALDDPDVLVNLAGANIGRPWTPTYRLTIRESRVATTSTLAEVVKQLDRRPVLITQSGVAGYGMDLGDRILTEDSELGDGFLADVVRLWEGALEPAQAAGSRVAALRTGVVLDRRAPAFQLLGLGGRLGSGRQYFPVVSLTDWIRSVRFVAENEAVSGPVNVALPTPATNIEFTEALATALRRPAFVPVPALLMKAALGEFAWELLGSKRVLPTRLQSSGFTFHHPTVTAAISAALS
jgi:uncharacterized protein (TIGR01777 family)